MAPPSLSVDPHWELIRQVAAADARTKRAGRRSNGIPPELSVPVLAAVALALRQQKAQEASPAPAFAVGTPEDVEEVTEVPPPRWRSLRACRDQGTQAGDPWIELADEGPPPQQEPPRAPPPPTEAEDTEEEGDEPMPVAEHRFLDIDPPVDAAASGMAALRKIFEEAAALSDWQPRASEEQATKAKIVEEVAQLLSQLESLFDLLCTLASGLIGLGLYIRATNGKEDYLVVGVRQLVRGMALVEKVLDVLLEDSSEAIIRLKRRRQVTELQRAFGDPENPDMTVRDFVEKCEQFEDELCKKYGVKSA
eukprot:s14_g3.t2